MEWRDDILADIPDSSNDNEPESLRAEILEELGDHLQCAMNRELLNHGDPQTARKNVIERFGNVSQVARQMWFEAMKGQIMSQRLMVAMTVVMFLCCMAMGAFAFFSYSKVRQLQEVAMVSRLEAMQEQERAIQSMQLAQEQSRLASEQLQKQLATIAEAKPTSMDWNPFKVKLVDENGAPAPAGFKLRVLGKPHSEMEEQLTEVSGEDGLVDFGAIRPGYYTLGVTSPWNERLRLSRSQSGQRISPGSDTVREIVCPARQSPKNPATFKMDWPDDFVDGRQPGVAALVFVSPTPRTVGNLDWQETSSTEMVFFPDGRVFEVSITDPLLKRSPTAFSFILIIGEELTGRAKEFFASKIKASPAVLVYFRQPMFPQSENGSWVRMIAGGSESLANNCRAYIRGESLKRSSSDYRTSIYEGLEDDDMQSMALGEGETHLTLSIPEDAVNDARHHGFILRLSEEVASSQVKRSLASRFYTKDLNHDQKLTRDEYGTDDEETIKRTWTPKDNEFPLTAESMLDSYDKWYAERRKAAASRNGGRGR